MATKFNSNGALMSECITTCTGEIIEILSTNEEYEEIINNVIKNEDDLFKITNDVILQYGRMNFYREVINRLRMSEVDGVFGICGRINEISDDLIIKSIIGKKVPHFSALNALRFLFRSENFYNECFPEFVKSKPKDVSYSHFWWDMYLIDVRINHIKNIIKELKNEQK
jgi:hypothetical protein